MQRHVRALGKHAPQYPVRRHAAGEQDGARTLTFGGPRRFGRKYVNHGFLKRGRGLFDRWRRPLVAAHEMQHGRFQAAKAHVVAGAEPGARQAHVRVFDAGRDPFDLRPTGEPQPEESRDFIERLTSGIVPGTPQALDLAVTRHQHHVCVAARNHQPQERKLRCLSVGLLLSNPVRVEMRFQVVDGDQRQAFRVGQRLGHVHADEQRPNQSRARRDGDGVQLLPAAGRLSQRRFDDGQHRLQMLPGRYFGNDATVAIVEFRLGRDHAGQNVTAVFNNRGRRFVAGRLNAEDLHDYGGRMLPVKTANWCVE